MDSLQQGLLRRGKIEVFKCLKVYHSEVNSFSVVTKGRNRNNRLNYKEVNPWVSGKTLVNYLTIPGIDCPIINGFVSGGFRTEAVCSPIRDALVQGSLNPLAH